MGSLLGRVNMLFDIRIDQNRRSEDRRFKLCRARTAPADRLSSQ